jgi:hypothetical protein
LIWRSRWVTDDGIVECREALAFPGDALRAVVLRRIIAVEGEAHVRVHLEARGDYGKDPLSELEQATGIWTARTGPNRLRWSGAVGARPSSSRNRRHLTMELSVGAGQFHDLVLEVGLGQLPDEPIDSEDAWIATTTAWEEAVPPLSDCLSPPESRHSYAVLPGAHDFEWRNGRCSDYKPARAKRGWAKL